MALASFQMLGQDSMGYGAQLNRRDTEHLNHQQEFY